MADSPSAAGVRIIVNAEKCQGHARCAALNPDLFRLDDNGYIMAGDIEIDAKDASRAVRSVRACPERALEVEAL